MTDQPVKHPNLLTILQQLGDAEHSDLSVAHDAREEIIRLRMALEQAQRERDEYRARFLLHPISTAPKDRRILLLSRKGRVADGDWKSHCWVWPYVHIEPTHWQELPEEWQFVEGEKDDA